jgi:hypothetical protein
MVAHPIVPWATSWVSDVLTDCTRLRSASRLPRAVWVRSELANMNFARSRVQSELADKCGHIITRTKPPGIAWLR